MDSKDNLIAVIPARGGSKGLPGKNIRPFAGHPLIAHSIFFAQHCPSVKRTLISTDSQEIAAVAQQYKAEVPFVRPPELAQDDTPLWPVLRHALEQAEQTDQTTYDYLLLLDPTTPCRLPQAVEEAFATLKNSPQADGVVGVSKPDFNPIWNCVKNEQGWMKSYFKEGDSIHRRQDAPEVFRINGSFYIWRTSFMRQQSNTWRDTGQFLMHEIPDFFAISIDTLDEFKRAELYVKSGLIRFPWLKEEEVSCAQ